jgi:hypothetical protein
LKRPPSAERLFDPIHRLGQRIAFVDLGQHVAIHDEALLAIGGDGF